MDSMLRLRCPGCGARIKAPPQLLGQTRDCPGCGHRLVIRTQTPEDSTVHLVHDNSRDPSRG
jgi:DNA-directed RNA polymerase subunit RPC12/RpoP